MNKDIHLHLKQMEDSVKRQNEWQTISAKKGKKVGESSSSMSIPTGPQAVNKASTSQTTTSSQASSLPATTQQASFPPLPSSSKAPLPQQATPARPPVFTGVQSSLGKAP